MEEKNKSTKGFLGGVSLLTLSALLVKLIGLLYRVPMLAYLGTEGMGYFNTAYELYALFCIISTAGLPVAMSVLISASGSSEKSQRIFRVSLAAFLVLGLSGTLLLYGFSDALAAMFKSQGAAAGMRMIAPTVLLICLSGAFRGYFQGKRSMLPTAVSQVIEALGKLCLGLTFAALAQKRGCDLPETAAYAVLGLTLGTGISVLYLWIHKTVCDRRATPLIKLSRHRKADLDILGALLVTAVPVTLGAAVMSVTKVVDLALILRRLQSAGLDEAAANTLYGCYSTLVLPLFHMLPTLTTSVSLPTVPALSGALSLGTEAGRREAQATVRSALALTLTIGVPSALGLAVFAEDVLSLLFGSQPTAVQMATPWLTCIAFSVPMSCLITVTGAILQGAGYAAGTVLSLILGTAVKAVCAYLLLGNPSVGMLGAPISTLLCDFVIVCLNLALITRRLPGILPTSGELAKLLFVPLVTGGGAVALVWWLRRCLGWDNITPVHTIGSVAAVMCLYGGMVLLQLKRTSSKPQGDPCLSENKNQN